MAKAFNIVRRKVDRDILIRIINDYQCHPVKPRRIETLLRYMQCYAFFAHAAVICDDSIAHMSVTAKSWKKFHLFTVERAAVDSAKATVNLAVEFT